MSDFLYPQSWIRTIYKPYIEFKKFSINNIHGKSPGLLLEAFGKPDYSHREHLCYFNLGLEFLAYTTCIPYIYIHVRPHNRPYLEDISCQFQAFPGDFLYDGKPIDRSLLQNCDALIESFNDPRFRLYNKETNQAAYIEEINGKRERTVVFSYQEYSLDLIILY